MSVVRELLDMVRIRLDVEQFLNSEAGQLLLENAREEVLEAFEALKSVSPVDSVAVRGLQNKIWRAESFEAWLIDLQNKGVDAEQQLQQMECERRGYEC